MLYLSLISALFTGTALGLGDCDSLTIDTECLANGCIYSRHDNKCYTLGTYSAQKDEELRIASDDDEAETQTSRRRTEFDCSTYKKVNGCVKFGASKGCTWTGDACINVVVTDPPTPMATDPPTVATRTPTMWPTTPIPTMFPTTPVPTFMPTKEPSVPPTVSPSPEPTPMPIPSSSPTQWPSNPPTRSPVMATPAPTDVPAPLTPEEKEDIVQAAMDTYRHSLIQRTGSAKTTEPVTYVWSQASESCHQACIDAAGDAKDLYCYSDAMFGSTFDITDQMDPFCGVTTELVTITPPKTQSPSKSTRAPFRRERDGKCFRTGTAKGRHDCTWTQAGARRFCGCLAYTHTPKDHLTAQPAGRTADNPVGWNRVSDNSCDRFCEFAGLTCDVDKLNDVRGVYDMLDLLALVQDDIDGAYCKIWDARFSRAQAPKYRAKDGYCTVAPMENNSSSATCATKQTGDDFRLCYCN